MTKEEAFDDIVEKIALITNTDKGYVKNALINAIEGAKTEVKKLPSVTPQEPKTGRWIRVTDKAGNLVWECDKCSWQQ